jgi:hypothetical protein
MGRSGAVMVVVACHPELDKWNLGAGGLRRAGPLAYDEGMRDIPRETLPPALNCRAGGGP